MQSLQLGHEGIMARPLLDARYAAGARGQSWLKVKRARTLDLVILAAEWGHGRRDRPAEQSAFGRPGCGPRRFAMLGKTFKGLTDEMLAWQTQGLLKIEISRNNGSRGAKAGSEIAFNEIQAILRRPSGLALRFACVQALLLSPPRRQTLSRPCRSWWPLEYTGARRPLCLRRPCRSIFYRAPAQCTIAILSYSSFRWSRSEVDGCLSVLLAMAPSVLTNTLPGTKVLSGCNGVADSTAFLFARAITTTGFGLRIAYLFVRRFEAQCADAGIPLQHPTWCWRHLFHPTLRVVRCHDPISSRSLAQVFDSEPGPTSGRIGAFLVLVGFHVTYTTSAMFLTGMAANPLIAEFARNRAHVELTRTMRWPPRSRACSRWP